VRIARRLKAGIYDKAIAPMTAGWYASVLKRLEHGSRVLDIGIGTGAALVVNASLLDSKDVHVTGIDIDAAYVERCRETVVAHGLAGRVEARLQSVYDHTGGPYDAAYFSGSFMLLPDPVAALRHVASLLTPEGAVWFTQTFEHERSWIVERLKPALRFVTSIDFGGVTYERDFLEAIAAAGLHAVEKTALHAGRARSSVLVVAKVAVVGQAQAMASADESVDERDPDETVILPIEDAIDLHPFQPRDIPLAVDGYLEAAVEAGFREVRLIHGRGTGFQRGRVREILAAHSDVVSFADAPSDRGGWGATVVVLRPKE